MKSSIKNMTSILLMFYIALLTFSACKKNPSPVPAVAPTIASISPVSGLANTSVTITGSNFDATASNNAVKFNGVAATVNNVTTTTLVVVAPAGGSTGPVSVTTGGGTATGPTFTYTTAVDVYVAGKSATQAGYWKNGVFNSMPSDCFYANCIFVAGIDVYIGGVDNSYYPKYWKNGVGVSTLVTPGHNGGGINSIFVSGTDVYTAGADVVNGAQSIPKCWKNANPVTLNYQYGGDAHSVFVSGSDVYVAGSQWSGPSGGNAIATYWKNGIPTSLTDATSNSYAQSVFVVGSDVYVAGYGGANYWKNSVAIPLSLPANYTAYGWSVYVSGTDVYVSGSYRDLAKYWKNGSMVDLTTTQPLPSTFESAVSVTGLGTDIYIAGNDASKGYGYWKNGSFTVLPNCQLVSGIFVN
jgi:uncharacterized lipoprotein YajG